MALRKLFDDLLSTMDTVSKADKDTSDYQKQIKALAGRVSISQLDALQNDCRQVQDENEQLERKLKMVP